MSLSETETRLLALLHINKDNETIEAMQEIAWLKRQDDDSWKPNREAIELAAKLVKLGICPPWV